MIKFPNSISLISSDSVGPDLFIPSTGHGLLRLAKEVFAKDALGCIGVHALFYNAPLHFPSEIRNTNENTKNTNDDKIKMKLSTLSSCSVHSPKISSLHSTKCHCVFMGIV